MNKQSTNVVGLAEWVAAKNPSPTALLYDLRPRLPVKKAMLAQKRNAAYANTLALRHHSGFKLDQREIAYLAMVLDARVAERERQAT